MGWREGDVRIPSGCAIAGLINRDGRRETGSNIIQSIAVMHERSNGLGGGFAGYGIFPEHADYYALQLMYSDARSQAETEEFIERAFFVETREEIPVRPEAISGDAPLLWRYFVQPADWKIRKSRAASDEFMVSAVMEINARIDGAYVLSSGKNMGAFKGVGFPEDIGEFFRLDEYRAHTWIAHGRFPTNTPGWWGGAHPFSLLDWAVVHNGEISSYGANRRYLEMHGYQMTLQTDTEVLAYAIDLLVRRHELPLETVAAVFAPPLWQDIDRMPPEEAGLFQGLRMVYGSLLMNGPFSILVASGQGLLALNDRLKLRSLAAAEAGATVYVASEEAAIRAICPDPERVWYPKGGEPVVARLQQGVSGQVEQVRQTAS